MHIQRSKVYYKPAERSVDEQLRLFGEVFDPQSDEEARTLALTYLEEKHADALRAMDAMEWLDIDRVAARASL